MNPSPEGYGSALLPQHQALLSASAISPEVARARGYVSVTEQSRLKAVGFSPVQRQVPGLLIPVHGVTGEVVGHEYRPDTPRVTDTGKVLKYEKPTGSSNHLDVPPAVLPVLGDPNVSLWITEGARKVDAAVTAGLACVGLAGVWGWRCTNGSGGKVALPDFHEIAWNDREVVVCFDSDVMTKSDVRKAIEGLRQLVFSVRRTHACVLPNDGDKVGLDDYLANGGTRESLGSLVVDRIPDDVVDRALPEREVPDVEPEDGHAPLDAVAQLLRRYVTADKHVLAVCAVWVVHAYAIDRVLHDAETDRGVSRAGVRQVDAARHDGILSRGPGVGRVDHARHARADVAEPDAGVPA